MKYLNPFHILGITPESLEQHPTQQLKQLRQQLLAEFELHDTATLELAGREIDKAGLLFLLTELEDEAHRPYHATIFEQESLRKFLEDGELACFDQPEALDFLQQDAALAAFVAPHFARQYNTQLYHAVKHQKAELVNRLTAFRLPFSHKWVAQCYQDAYRFLVYQLKDAHSMDRKVQVVSTYRDILLLLPPYFDTVRNMYKPYQEAAEFAELTEGVSDKQVQRIIWIGVGIAATLALLIWGLN
ncbi:MAG: hypothetical protein D6730_19450 [Bacteroidetes bacterium]|nr:MAG: hypothetical protein D6730_19450 [Bacteroidota bacterium]